jgi:DNA-binding PadR family transcriptional regulator
MDVPVTTKAALLQALMGRPGYGRDLIGRIQSGSGFKLHGGSVYPALYNLEMEGLIRVKKVKKAPIGAAFYQLTKRGERQAVEQRRKVALLFGLGLGESGAITEEVHDGSDGRS